MTPDSATHSAPPSVLDGHTGNLANDAGLVTMPEVFGSEVRSIFKETLTETLERLMAPAVELEAIKRKAFLTEKEVALYFSVSARTLRNDRSRAGGPQYIKDGSKVLYAMVDLMNYYYGRRIRTKENL